MPPVRPQFATSVPHLQAMLTDDGSYTLHDVQLNETYHSGCGALAECLVVYLRNSGIEARLIARPTQRVRVLELGFGTGLGWLVTAVAAEAYQADLEYVSLEKSLLPVSVLQQLDGAAAIERAVNEGRLPSSFRAAPSLQNSLFQAIAVRQDDHASLQLSFTQLNQLSIIVGDARESSQQPLGLFDAIYFDAFSPATNPELWDEAIFQRVLKLLQPDGALVSYCVSGPVRRGLASAGFEVKRLPGPPGGKREVLVAVNRATATGSRTIEG